MFVKVCLWVGAWLVVVVVCNCCVCCLVSLLLDCLLSRGYLCLAIVDCVVCYCVVTSYCELLCLCLCWCICLLLICVFDLD